MGDNHREYKGYCCRVEIDFESGLLHGKIEFINDYVGFAAERVSEVESEFHKAVDEYLATCEELGKTPDKSFSGTFNNRIGPERHRTLAVRAFKNGTSINEELNRCIDQSCKEEPSQVHVHFHNVLEEKIDLTKPWLSEKTAPFRIDSPKH